MVIRLRRHRAAQGQSRLYALRYAVQFHVSCVIRVVPLGWRQQYQFLIDECVEGAGKGRVATHKLV